MLGPGTTTFSRSTLATAAAQSMQNNKINIIQNIQPNVKKIFSCISHHMSLPSLSLPHLQVTHVPTIVGGGFAFSTSELAALKCPVTSLRSLLSSCDCHYDLWFLHFWALLSHFCPEIFHLLPHSSTQAGTKVLKSLSYQAQVKLTKNDPKACTV